MVVAPVADTDTHCLTSSDRLDRFFTLNQQLVWAFSASCGSTDSIVWNAEVVGLALPIGRTTTKPMISATTARLTSINVRFITARLLDDARSHQVCKPKSRHPS